MEFDGAGGDMPVAKYAQDWEVNLKEGTWRAFDASRDLALGKVATASSEAGENVAKNVTAATTYADYAEKRWESAASDPQWVQVDLGSPMEVNRVILKWYAYAAKEFSVETSVDGETWKEVYHATAGSSFMVTDATFATTTGAVCADDGDGTVAGDDGAADRDGARGGNGCGDEAATGDAAARGVGGAAGAAWLFAVCV